MVDLPKCCLYCGYERTAPRCQRRPLRSGMSHSGSLDEPFNKARDRLRQNLPDHFAVNVGQAEVPTRVTER